MDKIIATNNHINEVYCDGKYYIDLGSVRYKLPKEYAETGRCKEVLLGGWLNKDEFLLKLAIDIFDKISKLFVISEHSSFVYVDFMEQSLKATNRVDNTGRIVINAHGINKLFWEYVSLAESGYSKSLGNLVQAKKDTTIKVTEPMYDIGEGYLIRMQNCDYMFLPLHEEQLDKAYEINKSLNIIKHYVENSHINIKEKAVEIYNILIKEGEVKGNVIDAIEEYKCRSGCSMPMARDYSSAIWKYRTNDSKVRINSIPIPIVHKDSINQSDLFFKAIERFIEHNFSELAKMGNVEILNKELNNNIVIEGVRYTYVNWLGITIYNDKGEELTGREISILASKIDRIEKLKSML